MKSFYEFMEMMADDKEPNLPVLPSGMMRLTHFTAADPNKLMTAGLKVGTILNSTADPHSTNEQVLQTIRDGEAAGMNRSHFGPYVVLIDMPVEYHRILSSPQNSIDVIPASQVLGYVDRQTMEFRPNSHYDPSKMQKPEIRNVTRGRGGSSSANHAQIPVPAPSASGASYDVF